MESTTHTPGTEGFGLRARAAGCMFKGICFLCGNMIGVGDTVAELFDAGNERLGIVCPQCIEAGDGGAATRARTHARRLREHGERLEQVAHSLASQGEVLPTPPQAEAAGIWGDREQGGET